MRGHKTLILGALLGAWFGLSEVPSARADFEACGNIFVSADAHCEFRKTESCMTQCTTETVETACAAKLYVSCHSQCMASASTTCTSGCSETCTTECTEEATQKEPPNCMGLCASDCHKTCANGARGQRGACCDHTCNARCEDKCEGAEDPVANPAECSKTCTTACSGSCTAQANVTCQQDCQTEVYTECETETIETCQTQCMDDGGALFCDGQFVNAASTKSCADELKAKLSFDINIDVKAGISAGIDDVSDGANATTKKGKAMCSVGLIGARTSAGMGSASLLGLCAAGLAFLRTRRRR
jgi:hypothetical protein